MVPPYSVAAFLVEDSGPLMSYVTLSQWKWLFRLRIAVATESWEARTFGNLEGFDKSLRLRR